MSLAPGEGVADAGVAVLVEMASATTHFQAVVVAGAGHSGLVAPPCSLHIHQ